MKKASTLLTALLGLSLTSSAFAYDFTNADALFAKRSEGSTDQERLESAKAARRAYDSLINSGELSSEDKIYAASQIGRLDLYRAAMLDGLDVKLRRAMLEECMDSIEKIADTGRQEYHYYKIACIAMRGKIADGLMDRAKYGFKMKYAQDHALKSTQVDGRNVGGYEAGGILRILAAVRGNIKAKALGLYNPAEGLEFAKAAIATAKTTYRPFTTEYSGKDFYENYYYYGQAMISVGMENKDVASVKKGAEVVQQISALIKQKEATLPTERKPERDHYMKIMDQLVGQVNKCVNESAWSDCLQKEFSEE